MKPRALHLLPARRAAPGRSLPAWGNQFGMVPDAGAILRDGPKTETVTPVEGMVQAAKPVIRGGVCVSTSSLLELAGGCGSRPFSTAKFSA